jgi:hypothetical protein
MLEQHRHLIFIDHGLAYIMKAVAPISRKMLYGLDVSRYATKSIQYLLYSMYSI